MIELSRKIEPKDIISALAGVSVSIDRIVTSRRVQPPELYRIIVVMEGVLALRQVIDVQQADDIDRVTRISAEMLSLATNVIQRAKCHLICAHWSVVDLESLIDSYSDALESALHFLSLIDLPLEQQFRTNLRWTTPTP
jgi:hypothetical protein